MLKKLENLTKLRRMRFDKDMSVNEIADYFSCRKRIIRDKMRKFGIENRKIQRNKVEYRTIDGDKYVIRLQLCGREDDARFMGGEFKIYDGESHYQFTIMACRDTITQKIKRRL